MRRAKLKPRRDLSTIGREVIKQEKADNLGAVAGFDIDEPVQYYSDGWRYGFIRELPARGLNRGRARVEHSVSGKKTWVEGTGLKKMVVESSSKDGIGGY